MIKSTDLALDLSVKFRELKRFDNGITLKTEKKEDSKGFKWLFEQNDYLFEKVLELLFPDQELTEAQKNGIRKHILSKNQLVVLYAINDEFNNVCKELNLKLGKPEVILKSNGSIMYTADFHHYPKNLEL